jgi:hypothetical protein
MWGINPVYMFLETVYLWYISAVFQNSELTTILFQVHRCIPIYLAAIPIPPETHILFYVPF